MGNRYTEQRNLHTIFAARVYFLDPTNTMAIGSALKSLKPKIRPQATDVQAAAAWGIAAFTTAVWIVQPFDWVKKTFFEKPAPEEN